MNDRNSLFLQEMGLGPRWSLRDAAASAAELDAAAADAAAADAAAADAAAVSVAPAGTVAAQAEPGSTAPANIPAPPFQSSEADHPSALQIAAMSWPQLQASIAACRKCPRCEMRRHAVAGAGDTKANWLFVGAAPESDDSPQAQPLAGAGPSLFNNMLAAIGQGPNENAYLTTTVKCRATDDRAPSADELAACRPYLERQIALLQPTVMVAFGAAAAAAMLGRDPATALSTMRGAAHRYGDLPLIVTHEPRHLLLHPTDKREAWVDLCLARDTDADRT